MAERYPEELIASDPIETSINQCCDHLVECIDRRRMELLTEYRDKREQRLSEEDSRLRTRRQLASTQSQMQEEMNENILHSIRARMGIEIDKKMRELELTVQNVELLFEYETRQMEESISRLGQLVEREVVPIPNYANLKQPRISVCEKGYESGKLNWVNGIAYEENSQLIFVVDHNGSIFSPSGRICVFSEQGEYIDTFGESHLKNPVGIAISGKEVFVSDEYLHTILHFKLPNFRFVAKVGKEGAGKKGLSSPRQLTVATNGDVYVADHHNDRVVVLDSKLKYRHSIEHVTMTRPSDVKLLEDKVLILCLGNNPCLHEFSKAAYKLRSFITCGKEGNDQVSQAYYFCLDKRNNILISDFAAKSIKVFSQEGVLLYTVGESQEKRIGPMGILTTPNNIIICTSPYTQFKLHMLY